MGAIRAGSRFTAVLALVLAVLSFLTAGYGSTAPGVLPLFMPPETAAAVAVLGLLGQLEAAPRGLRGVLRLGPFVGGAVVAACVLGYVAQRRAGLPHTAPATLVALALLGTERLVSRPRGLVAAASRLALGLAAFVAVLALLGFVFRSRELAGVGGDAPMAATTAVCLLLLALSRTLRRGTVSWLAWILGRDDGARIGRNVLAVSIAAPVVIGAVALAVEKAGMPSDLVTALSAFLVATLFGLTGRTVALTLRAGERRRARVGRQLERARRELGDILEASPLAVYARDVDERYLFVNAAWEEGTGLLRAGVIGRHVSEIFPGEAQGLAAGDAELLARGGTLEEEERLTFGGAEHVVQSRKFALRDPAGRVYGVCGMSIDVTEQQAAQAARDALSLEVAERSAALEKTVAELAQANDELARANDDLDGFTYSVSHDLRAPLRAIDGFSKILLEDHASQLDDEAQRVLGVVRKNVVRMSHLIDDLLAFSRLGRAPLAKRIVDVGALVEASAQSAALQEPGRAVALERGPLPPLRGDPDLLRQVFENLLSNAFKYSRTQPSAVVRVAGEEGEGQVTYRVSDNGVGFDERHADKLFRVFSRLHKANEFEGTGVGLALVERIVRRHGGRVFARSRLGEGATFGFTLPAEGAPDLVASRATPGRDPRA